jgi:MYXO-CTERM domain-containing protein
MNPSHHTAVIALAFAFAWGAPGVAWANGNESHLWVSLWARDALPEGDLRSLLEAQDLALRNGSNFPDGGYAIDDGYGEIAHWEPFQSAYLDWIVAHHQPPWSDEAQAHIAFLMGMASHGMSDQTYDCAYLARSDVYDAGSPGTSIGRDGATDVALVAAAGCAEPPSGWVPEELMAQLMLEQAEHEVEPDTIGDGNALVLFSMHIICGAAEDEELTAEYVAAYPWAGAHQMDPDQPGNPPHTAPVVAAYWQALWAQLHGEDPLGEPLIGQFPPADAGGWPSETDSIDAMVSFVIARGVDTDSIGEGGITVRDAQGLDLPFELHRCYGSHVLGLKPTEGWTADSVHTVEVGPGLLTWDGRTLEPFAFEFDTTPVPVDSATPVDPGGDEGCGCAVGGRGGPLALWPLVGLLLGWRSRRRAAGPHAPGAG